MKRNRLLIVDGDPRSLRVLDVSLRSAGFDVVTASSGTEAWSKLESDPPDLVISDAELQGQPQAEGQIRQPDGFELCARLRATAGGATIPFILLGANQSLPKRIKGLECGAEDYLTKPAYVKEVLSRVRARLLQRDRDRLTAAGEALVPGEAVAGDARARTAGANRAFSGDLADLTVVDLVQLVEAKGGSGIIHLRGAAGTTGAIYVRQGKVVDAEVGQLSGMDALSRLFAWVGGTFELEWKTIRRKDVIERPPAELVIEGMQKLDDGNRLRQAFPDPRVVFAVDYPVLSARLAEIPDEMNSVLRLCNGMRTLEQILVDCPLPDVDALTALIRLREEGIILVAGDHEAESPHGQTVPPDPRNRPRLVDAADAEEGNRRDIAAQSGATPWRTSENDSDRPRALRRRTAPGLGQALSVPPVAPLDVPPPSAPDFGAAAVPRARLEEGADNLIRFPVADDPPSAWEEDPSQQPVAGLIEAPDADSILSPLSEGLTEVPRAPGAMSQTQRGFGRGLAREVEWPDSAVPVAVVDRRSSGSPEPSEEYQASSSKVSGSASGKVSDGVSGRVADAGSGGRGDGGGALSKLIDGSSGPRADGGERGVSGRAVVPTVEVAPDLSAQSFAPPTTRDKAAVARGVDDRSGSHRSKGRVVAPATAAEATERIRYRDDALSDHEARDELGVPSNWRGFRFLAVALLLFGLAAVVTHRLRVAKDGASSDKGTPAIAHEPDGTIPATGSERTGARPGPAPALAPPAEVKAAGVSTVPSAPAAAQTPAPSQGADDPEPAPPAEPAVEAPPVPAERPKGRANIGGSPAAAPVVVAATQPPRPSPEPGAPQSPSPPAASAAAPPPVAAQAAPPPPAIQPLATCRAAFAKGRIREALSACAAAVAANPRSAEALTMLAHSELNRGNLSRAGDLARKALAIDPNMADAYVIAGGVHQDSGQTDQAKAAYRRYLQLSPHGRYADELRSIVNSL